MQKVIVHDIKNKNFLLNRSFFILNENNQGLIISGQKRTVSYL
jgi:hypothetical protein